MGHMARPVAFRAREGARQGRLRWLLAVGVVNLMLWAGLIMLIARLSGV